MQCGYVATTLNRTSCSTSNKTELSRAAESALRYLWERCSHQEKKELRLAASASAIG
jgi:hypothetical protein